VKGYRDSQEEQPDRFLALARPRCASVPEDDSIRVERLATTVAQITTNQEQKPLPLLPIFALEILQDRLDDEIVHRPILLLAERNEPLYGALVSLLLGYVDA
jgi:hypothetical protein